MKQIVIKPIALILVFFTSCSYAGYFTDLEIKSELSGFGTLGAVYSDSENYGYRKDVSSGHGVFSGDLDLKTHSLLGLQLDTRLSDNVEFIAQAIVRDLQTPSFDRYLTLAFFRYDLSPHWSFSIGRTAPDLFLLTEFRDVDFSYHWATAPSEVYGIIPYRSLNGADVTYSTRIKNGTFKTKLFTGSSDAEIASNLLTETIKIDNVIGVSFSFEQFNWSLNANYSQVKIANEAKSNQFLSDKISQLPDFIWPNAAKTSQQLILNNESVRYASVSGQYLLNDWLFSAELAQINSPSPVIPKITSGYAGLSYQFNDHNFYGVLATTHSNSVVLDESGINVALASELIVATKEVFSFYASNQRTFSLGWRWDVNPTLATSLQWNNTHIDQDGGTLWIDRTIDSPAESVNTFMLNMSFIF